MAFRWLSILLLTASQLISAVLVPARTNSLRHSALPQTSGMNVALASNGGVATASSTVNSNYPASAAINGDRKGVGWGSGGGWNDGTSGSWPDWLQIDFGTTRTITEIDVFTVQDSISSPSEPTLTMTFSLYGITAFNVQYWDGSAWVSVPGGDVTGNNKVWRKFTFSAIATSKIRVNVTSSLSSYSRITEVEAWTPSQPPTVNITSPSVGTVFVSPANITINATASDSDGSISKVEFYQGSTKIGESTTSPYSYTWSGVSAGSYSLTARAIDDSGTATISPAVNVTVSDAAGSIAGRVTRAGTTTAIAGAEVKVYLGATLVSTTSTNSSGDYSVVLVNSGTYSVEVSVAGYIGQSQTGIFVSGGATQTVDFSLEVPINYAYDELGRLVGVIDKNGDAASYSYDAVGNLLSISRYTAGQTSIMRFSPGSGAIGAQVTIYGTGFSPTAAQNNVTFNGVSATVVSSSPSLIVTTVPSGAATGPIAVTCPGGSATSTASFVVASGVSGSPTITGFSPTVGPAGTPITITGSNFDSTSANDRVGVNITSAMIASAASTSIATTIPSATASGRISVSTPMGRAVSSGDFIVPPPPYTGSDIDFVSRMAVGETKTLSMNTANKIALMLFDGTANQRVSFRYTACTIGGVGWIKIFNPDGTALLVFGSASFNSSGFFEPIRLPVTGTYTIMVDPEYTGVGSMSITLYDVPPDITGTISISGPPVSVSTSVPGQNAVLTFTANPGQKVSLTVTNVTMSLADVMVNDEWVNVGSTLVDNTGGFMDTITLSSGGTYKVVVSPRTSNTGSATLTLNDTNEFTGTIAAGGSPVTVTLSTPGQNGRLTFSGTAGQRVSLKGAGNTIGRLTLAILNPNSTVLTSASGSLGTSPYLDVKTLPSTGTYSILVDAEGMQTGSLALTLYDVPADITGPITPGGSPVTAVLDVPGQNALYTFSGTAGQKVSVVISNSTIANGGVSIKNPDGSTLAGVATYQAFIDTRTLPTTGNYTVFVDPAGSLTGSITLALYTVVDVTGTLTIGASPLPITISTPGQNGFFTFSGTAGQQVTARMTNNTIGLVTVRIFKPDGTLLTYLEGSGTFNLGVQSLPVTGTYTLGVDPRDAATGGINIAVTSP